MSAVVTEEEIDKQHDEMADMWDDETRLENPDPDKRYKIVNKHPRRIAHWKKRGYVLTPASSKTKLAGSVKSDNGGQELGDNVLMETSMENFNRRRRRRDQFGAWREGSISNDMQENINRIARNEARVPAHKEVAFDKSGPRE